MVDWRGLGAKVMTGGVGFLSGRIQENTLEPKTLFKAGKGPKVVEVLGTGIVDCGEYIPSAALVTSALDVTNPQNPRPILSHLKEFQEPGRVVYQHRAMWGPITPFGQHRGLLDETRLTFLLPEFVSPPESGYRTIRLMTGLYDCRVEPVYDLGVPRHSSGQWWWHEEDIALNFPDAGYEELGENEKRSRELTIQLGVVVAMSDGELHDTEGHKIKEWMTKTLATYLDKPREEAKAAYNKALRYAFTEGKKGDLAYPDIVRELNKLTDKPQRYDAIELCYDVLAADGVAATNELEIVRQIAEAMELNYDEIEKIRDRSIVSLSTGAEDASAIDAMLNIDPSWSETKAKKHIGKEWQKWNHRIATLPAGEERDQAQLMADRLAEARKRYG